MVFQKTIAKTVSMTGVGLHSGQRVTMTFHPAPVDTGVVFRRVDLSPSVELPAKASLIGDTRMCSCLVTDQGVRVSTIEHLMSTVAGLAIDNLIVDLTASEVPILDGSASAFIFLLNSAGIKAQEKARRFLRITKTVQVSEGDKWVRVVPYSGFQLSFQIEFDHPAFSEDNQFFDFDASKQSYVQEIARARTFGFSHEVETLYGMGLAQGGNLDNAIVLDEARVLNPDGLRYPNEFVRHKILDAIGDLYLLGFPLVGRVEAFKSSHALNNLLARKILATTNAFEIISYEKPTTATLPEEFSWSPMINCLSV